MILTLSSELVSVASHSLELLKRAKLATKNTSAKSLDLAPDDDFDRNESSTSSSASSTMYLSFSSDEQSDEDFEDIEQEDSSDVCAEAEDPRIIISIDKQKQTITVTDKGIGMTKSDLANRLSLLSGLSMDFMEVVDKITRMDSFGIGIYGAFAISKRIEIITKRFESNTQCILEWVSPDCAEQEPDNYDVDFESSKCHTFNIRSIQGRGRCGTEIKIHVKDDKAEFLDERSILANLEDIHTFVQSPVILRCVDEGESEVRPMQTEHQQTNNIYLETLVNQKKPVWLRPPEEVSMKDYLSLYRGLTNDLEDSIQFKHFTYCVGISKIRVLLFLPTPHFFWRVKNSINRNNVRLYVQDTLVPDEFRGVVLPHWLQFMKGVIQSDSMVAFTDRKNSNIVRQRIVSECIRIFEKILDRGDKNLLLHDFYASKLREGLLDPESTSFYGQIRNLISPYSSIGTSCSSTLSSQMRTSLTLKVLLECSLAGILVMDGDGTILLTNTQTLTIFGYDRVEELLGKRFDSLLAKTSRGDGNVFRLRPSKNQSFSVVGFRWELCTRNKEGLTFSVEVSLNPLLCSEGTVLLVSLSDITLRKTQEESFRRIVEAAPNGMVMVNASGRIVLVNAQVVNMFGYTRNELIGRTIEDLLPHRFRKTHPMKRAGFFAFPSVRIMCAGRELFGLRKDGTEFPVEIGLNPIPNFNKNRTVVLASLSDITERKSQEESFRRIVEAAPNGMVMINSEGKIILVNAQMEKMFGYDRNELLGQTIEDLIPERLRGRHPGLRTGFFRSPTVRSMGASRELFGRRKDGSEFPVEIGLNPIENFSTYKTVVLASLLDITERRNQEESFRRIVEAAPNGMVMINSEGKIILVNAQMEKMFDYDRNELIGRTIEDLIPERFRGSHPGLRVGFFKNPAVRAMGAGRELFGLRKDGSEFPVEIGLNPINNFNRESAVVLASLSDITERKNQEESFRQIVEAAPNGMVMINAEGRIVIVNAQVEKMFGYNRNELIGCLVENLLPERFREKHPVLREEFFANPTVRSIGGGRELFARRKDGSEFPVEIGLNPINNLNQENRPSVSLSGCTCPFAGVMPKADSHKRLRPILVLAAIVDITERKRLEEKFRTVVESAPNGVIVLDVNGRVLLVNNHTERIFGYKRTELFKKHLEVLIPNDFGEEKDSKTERSTVHYLLRSDFLSSKSSDRANIFRNYIYGIRKNGAKFPLDIGINYVKNHPEEKMVIISVIDITERKRLEEECRQVLQRERDAAEREAQARSVLLAKMSHEIRTPLTGVLGCLELLNSMDDVITKNQTAKDLVETGLCCSNALLSVINDILNLSKLEAGVKASGEEASTPKLFQPQLVVDEVSTILSAIMHEKGLTWVTNMDPSTLPYLISYPGRIRQILLNLAANAIKFTDHGGITVSISCNDTSLAELHRRGGDILKERILPKSPTSCSSNTFTGIGHSLDAKTSLERNRVLWKGDDANSSDNLSVKIDSPNLKKTYLSFSVSDDGIGMTSEVQTKLFKPFYQADDSTTRKYGGTGLGLAISKQLIELMGGSVFVFSELGVGSHFIFDLLVIIPEDQIPQSMISSSQNSPQPKRKSTVRRNPESISILVAEDNMLSQKVVIAMLKKLGYTRITLATNGEEAVNFEKNLTYDLILMDCEMPIVDGFVATQTIREKNKNVPIVAMTANAMVGDCEYCMSHGMDDYLPKPVRLKALEDCLEKWT